MFAWLRNWWRRSQPLTGPGGQRTAEPVRPENVECDHPLGRAVIAAAYNTGDPVVGWVDEAGNCHIQPG